MNAQRNDSTASRVFRRARRRTWLWPLIGAIGFALAATWVQAAIEAKVRDQVRDTLVTIRDANVTALSLWVEGELRALGQSVRLPDVRGAIAAAVQNGGAADAELHSLLASVVGAEIAGGAILIGPDGESRPIDPREAGRSEPGVPALLAANPDFLERVLGGETAISRVSVDSRSASGSPPRSIARAFAWAGTPVSLGDQDAGLVLRREFGEAFDSVLRTARLGGSGETYVVGEGGALLSQSRFVEQLRAIGLAGAAAPDRLEVRNPGVNLLTGLASPTPREQQPLTRMAAAGLARESGFDIDGYRDYRGVPVVGAWTWVPGLGVVVASEIDLDEAYETLAFLRRINIGVIGILVAAAFAMAYHGQVVARLGRRVAESRRLGKYVLESKVGEGGMGAVYRARHAMLRRPTAIKLIRPRGDAEMLQARFEREVQAVSSLTHPNTVAVYDYGRTTDGVFYYAMEYLEGLSFRHIVDIDGPQPASRVIHLLDQVCGSLAEAHARGMVHRDIKPGNLMVCHRGGIPDFVKVLDFGLVRETASPAEGLTADNIVGTPQYMSPEAIRTPADVDARSDIYQLGLVAYFLLTGHDPFEGTPLEVIGEHLRTTPPTPSARGELPIPESLEAIVMRCLEKDRSRRQETVVELRGALATVETGDAWTGDRARGWWTTHEHRAVSDPEFTTAMLQVDIDTR